MGTVVICFAFKNVLRQDLAIYPWPDSWQSSCLSFPWCWVCRHALPGCMNLVVPNIPVHWNPLEDLLNQFSGSSPYQSWQGHRIAVLESSLMGLTMPIGNHTSRINELTRALPYSKVIIEGLVLPKKTWEFDVLRSQRVKVWWTSSLPFTMQMTDFALA